LGFALTEPVPRPALPQDSYDAIVAEFAGWESERFAARFQRDHVRTHRVRELNDFQKGLIRAAKRLPPNTSGSISESRRAGSKRPNR
jgi:hypothetical protein